MLKTVDCTVLVAAILWRAARDADSQKKCADEARKWLANDGLVLAASIGFDPDLIRQWLADPAPVRRSPRFRWL